MEIILLGTGGPKPDPHRQGPSLAVRIADTFLLFDAGRGVTIQLAKAGIALEDISHLFITHHHFDHIGGLGDFILSDIRTDYDGDVVAGTDLMRIRV